MEISASFSRPDPTPVQKATWTENKLVNEVYRYLLIMSSFLVCLAHGSNDVANTISQLIIVA